MKHKIPYLLTSIIISIIIYCVFHLNDTQGTVVWFIALLSFMQGFAITFGILHLIQTKYKLTSILMLLFSIGFYSMVYFKKEFVNNRSILEYSYDFIDIFSRSMILLVLPFFVEKDIKKSIDNDKKND